VLLERWRQAKEMHEELKAEQALGGAKAHWHLNNMSRSVREMPEAAVVEIITGAIAAHRI